MTQHDRNLTKIAQVGVTTAAVAETEFAGGARHKIGVLLCNLGTPDGTDYWSVRRYLAEFLSDRRVVEIPRLLWFFILNGLVLTTRPGRKGKDYASIWNRELDESPLKTITRGQAQKLQASIEAGLLGRGQTHDVVVEWGMRYGNPSLKQAIERLTAQGCDRLLLVPLYPQYAASTSATACDKVFQTLAKLRRQPALRVAEPYYDSPVYIEAVARSVERQLAALDFEPEVILASFHGVPEATAVMGDPYYEQCMRTGEALRHRLGLTPDQLMVTFQSRFGAAEWVKPYTDTTVKALAASGIKHIAVVTPGFSADCLETIEEIGAENAGYFREYGGETLTRIDCLNDSDGGMRVIETIVRKELQGWI